MVTMPRLLLMLMLGGCAWPAAATAATVEQGGARFRTVVEVGESTLPLRATHTFRKWTFKGYSAAFYVDPDARTMPEVLEAAPKRLVLHYHRDIAAEDIVRASRRMIEKNEANDHNALAARLDRLCAAIEDVEDGDRYTMTHLPAKGLELRLNGEPLVLIEGDDFAEAYLAIWLGPVPIDERMRDALLGRRD